MKIIRPDYYKDFNCIADKCDFTCCMEWDICVDPNTQKRWKQVGIKPEKYIHAGCGGDYITLNKDRKCPLLTKDGLCSLVLKYGEGMISKTCHIYPREKREFDGRTEESLAMGCPEALRLLWSQDRFETEEYNGSVDAPSERAALSGKTSSQDGEDAGSEPFSSKKQVSKDNSPDNKDELMVVIRNNLIDLIQNDELTAGEAIRAGFFILLDFLKKEKELTTGYIEEQFQPGILKQLKEAMAQVPKDAYDNIYEQNELFLDLADSYRKKGMYALILEPLAKLAEDIEDESGRKAFLKNRDEFEPVWQQMDKKIKLIIANEIFSSLYLPGNDIKIAVQKLEWIGIIYACLKQSLFLTWIDSGAATGAQTEGVVIKAQPDATSSDNHTLTDMQIRNTVVTVIRMAGYSQDDILEYLDNNFESPIWQWGYMNLIIKKNTREI